MKEIRVNASVVSDNPETITRAIEAFARATSGIALEGAEIIFVVGPEYDEETADTEEG